MNRSEFSGYTYTAPAVDNGVTNGRGSDSAPLALQYLRIALRRKWLIAGAMLACFALALLITLLMTPKYSAVTVIEIARESNKIVNLQGVEQDSSDADQEFYQTQYGLLRSQALAERVARELKLEDDPKFFDMFGKDPTDEPGQRVIGGKYAPAGRDFRTRLAGEILLDNIEVNPTRLSRLVTIAVTTPDASLSARIANAWVDNFIQSTLERRYDASSYARKFLENRLEQLRKRLEDSERQLVNYATAEKIIDLPGGSGENGNAGERSIAVDNLASLNAELARATADRVQAAARYNQLRSRAGESARALDNTAINTLRARRAELASDYEKMITQFEPAYPPAQALQAQIEDLNKSIAKEEQRVSGSLGTEYRSAVDREEQIAARVNELKNSVLDLRRRSIQYNIYQREVDSTRVLYNGLLQRYKEIGITAGVGVNNISIVDKASVPEKPSSPKLVLNIILSLILGGAIGAGLALLFEHVDESISDPDDVLHKVGVPLLGTVPEKAGLDSVDELRDRKSDLFDAYLAVQTGLALASQDGPPSSVAVTSTRPAEGKSTSAIALATTLVRSGRRTILVDGDMRSPSVHKLAGIGHETGLSTYLAGDDNIDQMLSDFPDLGFTVMTAGAVPPNAAELLSGPRFDRLIKELLTRFDSVIVDAPPVMGLADTPLIGSKVGGVVFIIEAHGVRARLAKTALERLRAAGANVVGSILTKFDGRGAAYGSSYAYEYGYGREIAPNR